MYAGIDGCKVGWICVRVEGNQPLFNLAKRIEDMEYIVSNRLSLIDIPIGLAESSIRVCDSQAHKLLRPKRHNSVFVTPIRDAVYAESYKEACEANYKATGKKISKQAWSISKKVREIDAFKKLFPEIALRESHPEVCFWALNGGIPCEYPKKTDKGIKERLDILENELSGIRQMIISYCEATQKKMCWD